MGSKEFYCIFMTSWILCFITDKSCLLSNFMFPVQTIWFRQAVHYNLDANPVELRLICDLLLPLRFTHSVTVHWEFTQLSLTLETKSADRTLSLIISMGSSFVLWSRQSLLTELNGDGLVICTYVAFRTQSPARTDLWGFSKYTRHWISLLNIKAQQTPGLTNSLVIKLATEKTWHPI